MTYTLNQSLALRGDPLGQWNQQPLQPFEAELYGLRPHVAWQTDTPANGGPDTGAEMWATVRIGWNYGMRFLEVQNVDVVNPDMQAPLACANQAMLTGDGSCLQ